jgi:hypothetical protein
MSVTSRFALTGEELDLLPTDEDVEFYAANGWYLSKQLLTDEEGALLQEASEAFYAGEKDREIPVFSSSPACRLPPEHHPLQHRDGLIRLGQPGGLLPDHLPQLLVHPHQLRVLLPELRVLPGQLIDPRRLPVNDLQRPCQQFLSPTARPQTAPRHRPCPAATATNHSKHRRHRQITQPARRVAVADRVSLRSRHHGTSECLRANGMAADAVGVSRARTFDCGTSPPERFLAGPLALATRRTKVR